MRYLRDRSSCPAAAAPIAPARTCRTACRSGPGRSITLLVACGIGWILSGITLQPIHRITQTAQKIGSASDFTHRVAYKGPQDEVGQLATTFNSMLTRLQEAYLRVENSLKMQQNFVADVSHELRTPLTTLRGNLGLLRRKPPIPIAEQSDILEDMVDESDRLIRLVNDLLVLARADARRNLTRETLAVSPILNETCSQIRKDIPDRQITINPCPDISFQGDRDAFKQILLIVLDNAIKHSKGDILLNVIQENSQVMISIQDNGEGISPEVLKHIFDRFFRGENQKVIPGFGLGLPIAKSLIEGQGGVIEITSELGQGSTVKLIFPGISK